MTPKQLLRLSWLRENLDIDVCYFPCHLPAPQGKKYKFYVTGKGDGKGGHEIIWNPVSRNDEKKVTGYKLFDTFDEGMAEAMLQIDLYLEKKENEQQLHQMRQRPSAEVGGQD